MQNPSTKKWYANLPWVVGGFVAEELRRGTLLKTLLLSLSDGKLKFAETTTLDSLLKRRSLDSPTKPFLIFEDRVTSFGAMNEKVGNATACLKEWGYQSGDGLALMLTNSPDFLAVYLATQRMGMYAVPVNTALVGEGLAHILKDSRVHGIVIEENFLPALKTCGMERAIKDIIVREKMSSRSKKHPKIYKKLGEMWNSKAVTRQDKEPQSDAVSTILYTSGTTGLPKGVVYKYGNDWLRKAGLLHRLIHNETDVLYTCLPLFHANALFLTMSASLWMGLPVVLSKRFSASGFWEELRVHKVTVFNAIGAMIPILLKNPPNRKDRENSVRLVLSAACPADCWREFESRFGVTIWEGYSAVDGGQNFIFNFGNAPAGSLGKMSFSKFRVIDEKGGDAKPFHNGELVFKTQKKEDVEYFHDEKSSREKVRDGYIRTGDIVYRDDKGHLYFVGRNTESMRRRGENVSAYEVEKVILQHKDVLECAVFGVPSELGEQDILCALVPVHGKKIDAASFIQWMGKHLARHAVPRFVRIMKELPKTPTHRVIKKTLEAQGITPDTFDAENKKSGGRS